MGKSLLAMAAIPQLLFPKQVLSIPQCDTIKNHQYKSGEYTYIDNILNPIWLRLTNFLPLWMAPNLVTLIGWFNILSMWLLLNIYAPTPESPTPTWVLLFAAWAVIFYQTM